MSKSQTAKSATKSTPTSTNDRAAPKTDLRTVPLDSLKLDPGNVRRTGVPDRATAELAASIASVGLITPLGCFEITKTESGKADGGKTGRTMFSVVAGGRRLAALQQLAADGRLPASLGAGIPIIVFSARDELTEISLAENIIRADMSAADQIEAWGRLHDEGLSATAIAARFGVAEGLVHQRVRLSKVAPPIIDALRTEEVDLGVVRAFTLTDDVQAQHALFTRLKEERRLYETAVRDALTDDKTSMGSHLAQFVGLDAYVEAGGTVTRDLFDDSDDGIILNDPAILTGLVDARIAEIVAGIEAEGWKWVEVSDSCWPDTHLYRRLIKEGCVPTEAETARLDEIREAMWQADDREALIAERNEINAGIDARGAWTEDQLAIAGVMVSIDSRGMLKRERGLVRKADDPTIRREAVDRPVIPAKLARDLGVIRTQIVQAHMLVDPELATDILAWNFAQEILHSYEGIGSIRRGGTTVHCDVAEMPFGTELTAFRKALDESWKRKQTPAGRLKAFRALPTAAKQAWIVYAVASSISLRLDSEDVKDDPDQQVAAALPIDWASAWRPDEAFWSRISRQGITALVEPVLGSDWMKEAFALKKAALATRLGDVFTGRAKSLSRQQATAVADWQVPGMRPHK